MRVERYQCGAMGKRRVRGTREAEERHRYPGPSMPAFTSSGIGSSAYDTVPDGEHPANARINAL